MRLFTARLSTFLSILLLVVLAGVPVYGQETSNAGRDSIPRVGAAEALFEEGVRAYEDGMYDLALKRFISVVEQTRFNRRTTGALLMAGHTLYELKRYDEAESYYSRLIENYPNSTYVSAARQALDTVDKQRSRASEQPEVVNLGVALPMGRDQDRTYTQAIFNGIRLAVDEFNAQNEEPKLRMVFRRSGQDPDSARQAVESLIREDSVDAIIGPLYSTSEVIPAANIAEDLGVPLVAPMATEEGVTMNRNFVFQVNPPLTVRGRLLAEYAAVERGYDRVGIITQLGTDGERMAKSFQSELERRNGEVGLFQLLTSGSDWYRLPDRIRPADTLQTLDALFLPITGDRAGAYTDAAISSLSRMRQTVPLLGNSTWRNIRGRGGMQRFNIIFEDTYWAQPARSGNSFERRYNSLVGQDPNHLAYVGYDVARFLTNHVGRYDSGEALADAIRGADLYSGEGIRIDFEGGQINQGIFYLTYRSGQPVVLE